MTKKNIFLIFSWAFLALFLATNFSASATNGIPRILSHQGRLLDSAGNLLGGSGTNYCFRFSLWDNETVGQGVKLWPSGTPSNMTASVKYGIYNTNVGDTSAGGDSLTYNFEDNDTIFLNIEVANSSGGSCAGVSVFENVNPRKRIGSAAYAINSATVRGVNITSSSIPLLGLNPQINATSTNTLTLQGGTGTGDIQFFNSSNKITSAGYLTIAGNLSVVASTTFRGVAYTWPLADGTNGQVLKTNGNRILSWADDLTGGGGGSADFKWVQNGSILYATTTATLIGIGTTQPSSTFYVMGTSTFRSLFDSTSTFKILNSVQSEMLFNVDTTNNIVKIGDSGAAGDPTTLLNVDVKADAGDPSGSNGATYYNSNTNKFRCFENSSWKDCDTTGGGGGLPSLRTSWFLFEDWTTNTITAGTGADLSNVGNLNWTMVSIGNGGTIAKNDVGAAASDQGRIGIIRLNSPSTANTGVSLRLDNTSINGVPGNMTVEFNFATVTDNIQQVVTIGLHDSVTTASSTDGIYFLYNPVAAAINWFRCTRNNNVETCANTGTAKAAINTYQKLKFVTNSAGTAVDFYIDDVSVGTNSTNLPAAARSYGPTINVFTRIATIRQWKSDYYQLTRTGISR